MNIILFRHGNAEDRKAGLDDRDRKLTQKGIDTVITAADYLSRHLENKGDIQLWSSPLIRAVQTASVVKEALDLNSIKELDCIATGDYEGLQSALLHIQENATVIVVGHNPSLEEWYQEICGQSLHLKKASAVDINILQRHPLIGNMVWSRL